jgi:hypothetical protein
VSSTATHGAATVEFHAGMSSVPEAIPTSAAVSEALEIFAPVTALLLM